MKIVVSGGSGLIGTQLVNRLREHGHKVVAASPTSGVDTLTGEGLAEVLQGASVVRRCVEFARFRGESGDGVFHDLNAPPFNL
jgi:uncharacterized protein YbjT (DUF2867 family)